MLHEIDFINLAHQSLRGRQGCNDFSAVLNVFDGDLSAAAVFEPFLGGLVSADVELPGRSGHVVEVPFIVNPDAAGDLFFLFDGYVGLFGCFGCFEPDTGLGQFPADDIVAPCRLVDGTFAALRMFHQMVLGKILQNNPRV